MQTSRSGDVLRLGFGPHDRDGWAEQSAPQHTAGDHVKTNSRAVRNSSSGSGSSCRRRSRKIVLKAICIVCFVKEHTVQQPKKFDGKSCHRCQKKGWTLATEMRKSVRSTQPKSMTKEMMDTGGESRIRTVDQVDEGDDGHWRLPS